MVEITPSAKMDHRTRILDAAAELFLKNGFEQSSTAEIAKGAMVSKRELYTQFASKGAILAAVISRLQEGIQSQVNTRWRSRGDLRTVLTEAGTAILEFVRSEEFGKLFRIVAAETFRDPISARNFYLLGPGAGRKDTAAFMKRYMLAGALRKSDPLRAADDFLDLIISARHLTALVLGQDHEVPKMRVHVKHAVEMFLRFYSPQPDGKLPRAGKSRSKRDVSGTR